MDLVRDLIYKLGFAMIYLCGSIFLILLARHGRRGIRIVIYNLAFIFMALFVAEVVYFFVSNSGSETRYSGSFFDNLKTTGPKEDLGYGPDTGSFSVKAIRYNGGDEIYNARYSFKNGMRQTPGSNESSKKFALFLGCSFTFGDGLDDNETLPFYFNQFTERRFNTLNFGFSGYGTHQALRVITEKVLKRQEITGDSNLVIYSFIPEHFLRAAGKTTWDDHGPHFELENNQLVYKGTFNDSRIIKTNWLSKRLRAMWSNTWLSHTLFKPRVTREDVDRVLAIVKEMNRLLSERKIRFLILQGMGEPGEDYLDYFYTQLQKSKVSQIFVDSILRGQSRTTAQYFIPGDGHPNALYNAAIARQLAAKILTKK